MKKKNTDEKKEDMVYTIAEMAHVVGQDAGDLDGLEDTERVVCIPLGFYTNEKDAQTKVDELNEQSEDEERFVVVALKSN